MNRFFSLEKKCTYINTQIFKEINKERNWWRNKAGNRSLLFHARAKIMQEY